MTLSAFLGQALRMTRRDWRGGELRLLAAAVVLAVASISSVGFFVDRLHQGLQGDAARYLGGDAVVEADRPIDAQWEQEAQQRGLRSARALSFPSMAMSSTDAGASTLVAVKAVSPGYPLRGAVQIEDAGGPRSVEGGPPPGSVWVDSALLSALNVRVGDVLVLGKAHPRIGAVLTNEPDRATQILGFAPRVLLAEADLPGTGLVQPASRINYRWMVAGTADAVKALVRSLQPRLQRGQRLETLDDGRPELQRTLGRADHFLGLVALLSALIAAVAINSGARRFAARRLDSCALMRCLGLPQARITGLFAVELLLVGLGASLSGVLAGFALHGVLLQALASLLPGHLPAPGVLPALQGLLLGLVLLLGFALPPLEQLRRVAPLRVMRRDVGDPPVATVLAYGAAAAALAVLLVWVAGDLRLGAIVGAGFAACIGVFALAAWGLLRALRAARSRVGALPLPWRLALAALQRRPGARIAQLVALALGLMALLLLAIVRTDLIEQWRNQAPPGAPNRFIINIQPDQAEALHAQLQHAGIVDATLEPMIRGRLVEIDGRRVQASDYEDERSRALVEREFNLSYSDAAPPHNRIVQGAWFAPGAPELSIEEGIAQRLHIALGQRVRFDVGGQLIEARVGSVRKVNWDSMRVNFFVIMAPVLLRDAPQTLVTSFYLPPAQAGLIPQLVRAFPNITVIDIEQVLGQLRATLGQIVVAAQFLFAFALAAGVLVLYAALAAAQDERLREAALLRALGASRRQLAGAQRGEMLLAGGLAGLLAAGGAVAVAAALARFVFEFTFVPHPWVVLAGVLAGIAAAWLGSWPGMRQVLASAPMLRLREA